MAKSCCPRQMVVLASTFSRQQDPECVYPQSSAKRRMEQCQDTQDDRDSTCPRLTLQQTPTHADAAPTCSVPESSESLQLLFRTSDRGYSRAGVGFHNDRRTWHFLPAACSNPFLVTQPRARKLPRRCRPGFDGENIFNSIVDCQSRSLSPISTMASGNRQSEMPFCRPVPVTSQ